MKQFGNEETQKKFEKWLTGYPESYHGLDIDRFYDFVLSLKQNQERITEDELDASFKEEKEWNSEFRKKIVSDYFNKHLEITMFIDFLTERNLIKI
jgi:hypothetical protein